LQKWHVYGRMYGMRKPKKTTIYLPEKLKHDVERVAKFKECSGADIIRDAVAAGIEQMRLTPPAPRIPLGNFTLGAPDIAARAEELLEGFGQQ
jgi:hypothetical protein